MPDLTSLTSMAEDTTPEPTRILSYGHPGTGKTIAAAHATAVADKVLWIDAEPGRKAVAFDRFPGIDQAKLYPLAPKDISFNSLQDLFDDVHTETEKGTTRWAVVIDTITNLQYSLLTDTVDRSVKRNADRKGEPTKPHLEDYGTNTEEMRRLTRQLATSSCDLVITAHVRDEMEGTGRDKRATGVDIPAVTEKFGETLFGLMDVVAWHTMSKGQYMAMFVPTNSRRAKDRVGTLPVILPDPHFHRVHQYLTGELTQDADKVYQRFAKNEAKLIERELRRAGR